MKKTISTLLALLLALSLVACGNNSKNEVKNTLVENGLSSEEADEIINELTDEDLEELTGTSKEDIESETTGYDTFSSTYEEKQFEPCVEIINSSLKDAYIQLDDVLLKMDGSMTIGEVVTLLKQGTDGEYYSFKPESSDEEFQFDTAIIAQRETIFIDLYKNDEIYAVLEAYYDQGQSEESAILVKDALFVCLRVLPSYKSINNTFIIKGIPFNGSGFDYTSIEDMLSQELTGTGAYTDYSYFEKDMFNVQVWDNNSLPSGMRCKRVYSFRIDMSTQQLIEVNMTSGGKVKM